MAHYYAKVRAEHFPEEKGRRCRWEWFNCPHTTCDEHLWDKRERSYFPDKDDTQNSITMLLINNQCTQNTWHTCMHPACLKHRDIKEVMGFAYLTPQRNTLYKPRRQGKGPNKNRRRNPNYRAPELEIDEEELGKNATDTKEQVTQAMSF